MLVLNLKKDEGMVVGGARIVVVRGEGNLGIGVAAPRTVQVMRDEVVEREVGHPIRQAWAYAACKPCGCVVATINDGCRREQLAETVHHWLLEGYTVEHMQADVAAMKLSTCRCQVEEAA